MAINLEEAGLHMKPESSKRKKENTMKRILLLALFALGVGTLSAQNCIVVDSEKIFKSIDAYNEAITELDRLAEEYQIGRAHV